MDIQSTAGYFYAEVAWNWTQSGGAAFVWSLASGIQTNPNAGDAVCDNTQGDCQINSPKWNFANPFRITFGADKNLGAGWWNVTIFDLSTGALIDLGSIKTSATINTPHVNVREEIYRPTLADSCPGDAAPIADTYFGPIIDSTGAEDPTPTGPLVTHSCANAEFGTLNTIVGGYIVYGGSKASIESAARLGGFTASSLLTTTTPPVPEAPSQFTTTTSNGILSLFVQVPHLNLQSVKAVYLVSPELGHPQTNPVYATLAGTSAKIQVPITNQLLGQTLNLSFYAQTGFVISDPLQISFTVPKNALQKPTGSHAIPNGISPASTIATNVPATPKSVFFSVKGNTLSVSAASSQITTATASNAYLIAPLLNSGSPSPISLNISGTTISYSIKLSSALQGKVLKYSIYLSNRVGKLKVVSGSYQLPSKIPGA